MYLIWCRLVVFELEKASAPLVTPPFNAKERLYYGDVVRPILDMQFYTEWRREICPPPLSPYI